MIETSLFLYLTNLLFITSLFLYLTNLLLSGDDNLLIFSLRNVFAQDKQKTIDLWCTLGNNLKYPCVSEAWMVFYQQLCDS